MDWEDELPEADAADEGPTRAPFDLAGMALSANGFLVIAFGTLLLMTPVGDAQEVDAPDFGPLEAMGIVALGLLLVAAFVWRRDRLVAGPVAGAAGLLGAVAVLAIVGAGLMAVCPTLGLLALINRPLPAVADD